jgi:microcystin-dependent protein
MSQPFVGQMIRVGFNFPPAGWMRCQGQLVPIAQYETLFNLIGTTYGGDGQNTFALPDLQGRVTLSMGQGPGLSNYVIGQQGGTETVTLTTPQLPQHQHFVNVITSVASGSTPGPQALLANEGPSGITQVYTYAPYDQANQTALNSRSIGFNSGNQPHENRQPLLAITWCISMFGIYPSQN